MTFKKAAAAAQHPLNDTYRPGEKAMEDRHRGLVACLAPTFDGP